MRLIDADALMEKLTSLQKKWKSNQGMDIDAFACVAAINAMPTVDAVEVVRCGECAHNCGRMDGYICCDKTKKISIWHSEDWFCSDGVARNP